MYNLEHDNTITITSAASKYSDQHVLKPDQISFVTLAKESKKDNRDQESIQTSTTPDPGY